MSKLSCQCFKDYFNFSDINYSKLKTNLFFQYFLKDPQNPRFSTPRSKRTRFPGRLAYAAGIILFFGMLLTILNVYELHQIREDHNVHINTPLVEAKAAGKYGTKQPVVWVNGKQVCTVYSKILFW